MWPVIRLRRQAAFAFAAAVAVAPLTVHATSSPNPSLDTVLAAPPSADFAELTTSILNGKFTAHDWAALSGDSNGAAQTEATLNKDGFVDGFSKTWSQASSGHALIELVMAFSGGRGAHSALSEMEASDKSDTSYSRADTVSGISPYYGAHFVYTAQPAIEDFFAFVKGNDVFAIAFVSPQDDVLSDATKQVQTQYISAPGFTIPTSEWPENISPASAFPVALFGAGIGFIVVVAGIVAFVVVRRRAPTPSPYASFAPALSLQMSDDGSYWWDGQSWRDAVQEVPPLAQRSSDGFYWWDGRTWRPMPQPPVS
jgi:hypothetical protein